MRQKTSFYGKWMEVPNKLQETCDFINKTKCCKEKQKLHFVFNNKILNTIDAVEEMRKVLQQKRILFIGDSMMFEFYNGIRELLKINETKNETKSSTMGSSTLGCLMAITIYMKASSKALNIPTSVTEETLTREIEKYDIIVFNQGLHYIIGPLEKVAIHFIYMGKFLRELTYNTSKQASNSRNFLIEFLS